MPHGCFQRVTRFAVSAALLLMALTPPAVRHSHAGGERAHRHSVHGPGATHLSHHHHHVGEPVHSHNDHDAVVDCWHRQPGTAVGHCHLAWFGFELVLPTPALPSSSQGDNGPTQEFVRPFAENDFIPGLQQATSGANVLLLTAALPSISGLVIDAPPCHAATDSVANHLCDTARHERSGVQLI